MNSQISEAAAAPAIAIRDLWKSFGDLAGFRGLSLEIRRGEAIAIIGGSGSGKSVLLKHIVDLLHPDRAPCRSEGPT